MQSAGEMRACVERGLIGAAQGVVDVWRGIEEEEERSSE